MSKAPHTHRGRCLTNVHRELRWWVGVDQGIQEMILKALHHPMPAAVHSSVWPCLSFLVLIVFGRLWGQKLPRDAETKFPQPPPGTQSPERLRRSPGTPKQAPRRLKLALLCPVICPSQSIHLSGGNHPSEGFQVVPGPSVPFEYLPSLSIRSSN